MNTEQNSAHLIGVGAVYHVAPVGKLIAHWWPRGIIIIITIITKNLANNNTKWDFFALHQSR